jgi:mannose-6-phosphate isomerase-like protein (cupin superfamily)
MLRPAGRSRLASAIITCMAYDIHTDIKYAGLELIDVSALAAACSEPWWNQSLCRVNACVVRLGVFHGEFHWHKHDAEDEYFQVLEGLLLLDLRDESGAERTVELAPGQGMMVPRGALHRTRAPQRTVVLMIEGAGVVPTGDG